MLGQHWRKHARNNFAKSTVSVSQECRLLGPSLRLSVRRGRDPSKSPAILENLEPKFERMNPSAVTFRYIPDINLTTGWVKVGP
jgi:hypothetical protein